MEGKVHIECLFNLSQIGGEEISQFHAIREKDAERSVNRLYFGLQLFLDEFSPVVVGAGVRVFGQVLIGEVVGLVAEEEGRAVLTKAGFTRIGLLFI